MANELTGEFDVVAEFSIPAADRVLAAMHRGQRFPHSLSIRVDDSPGPEGLPLKGLAMISIVDRLGAAVTDPVSLAQAAGPRRPMLPLSPAFGVADLVVNDRPVPWARAAEDYSHLQGIAQLQLSTPTISIPDQSGTRATVHISMMAQYFPDANTLRLPKFLRGKIQIGVGVDKVASQIGNVVDISLKPSNVSINFVPAWNSPFRPPWEAQSLGNREKTAINKAIRNSILTSFQPFNAVLPLSVQQMQFKTMPGGLPAIGVLLNMSNVLGDPASVDQVLLSPGDDFVFVAGRDFLLARFNAEINKALNRQFSIPVDATFFTTVYAVSLNTVAVELLDFSPSPPLPARIRLTIGGRAETRSILPNFHFRVTQDFLLNLVDDASVGSTAELAYLRDITLDITTGGVAGWLANRFKRRAANILRQRRDQAVAQVQPTVRRMLSADVNLGGFLKSLMKPTNQKPGGPPQEELSAQLAYTAVEIRQAGVILHGSLSVPAWPPAHVEFKLSPWTANTGTHEFTALNSWIPGGTIQEYRWSKASNLLSIEPNKFVYAGAAATLVPLEVEFAHGIGGLEPAGSGSESLPHLPSIVDNFSIGFTPLCLTVKGTRVSASGPAVLEPVRATLCGWSRDRLSLLHGLKDLPDIALVTTKASGALEVAGHASPWSPGGGANLIVHFPDERSAANLDFLPRALAESGRDDTAASIIAVLPPDQLARIKPNEGLTFAEDHAGTWERLLGIKRRPATVVVGPSGHIVWQHEGELTSGTLAAALKRNLVAGEVFRPSLLELSVRIGQSPPNFIFVHAPGREITLRKLIGRPVVLVFWKSFSKPSLEAVRDLQRSSGRAGAEEPVVLAINDGEATELARKIAAENGLSATLVTDPERQISRAYGVSIWPTTVFVDALGVVRDIRYGRFSGEKAEDLTPAKMAAAQ